MITDYLRFDDNKDKSEKKIIADYFSMCKDGQLDKVKELFKLLSFYGKTINYKHLIEGIYITIKNNDKLFLKYLLLNIPIVEEEDFFKVMTYIGRYGDGDLLEVLHHHYKDEVENKIDTSEILVAAVENNNIDMVDFLLTNKEIKNPDIHLHYDKALRYACTHEHIDIIKFLLTSEKLKEKANIHAKNDECLIWSFKSEKFKTVDYLLFEYKIKMTEDLKTYVKNNRELIDYINKKGLSNG